MRALVLVALAVLVGCSDNSPTNKTVAPAPVVAPPQVVPAAAPKPTEAALPRGTILVPITAESGGFAVPVELNGSVRLNFLIDSGASYVSIPSDVVMTLIRTGTVSDDDFVGTQTFTLADGSTVPSPTFRLRTLKVGSIEVHDVLASVGGVNSQLLLGETFLQKFASWSIDNGRNALLLTGSGAPTIQPSTTTPQIASDVPTNACSTNLDADDPNYPCNGVTAAPTQTEQPPTWAAVASTDKVSDFVDTANITTEGDSRYFWVKAVLTNPYQSIKYVVTLRQVTCSSNQTRTLMVSSFDSEGQLVKRTTDYASQPWGSWKSPDAGSPVQTEVQQVCGAGE